MKDNNSENLAGFNAHLDGMKTLTDRISRIVNDDLIRVLRSSRQEDQLSRGEEAMRERMLRSAHASASVDDKTRRHNNRKLGLAFKE